MGYLEQKFHQYVQRYKFTRSEKLLIQKALDFATLAHNGQKRLEGSPYVTHPIRVASVILHEIAVMKCDVICAALLHDVIEDCSITLRELRNNFNDRIAQMVKTLSVDPRLENAKAVYYQGIVHADEDVRLLKLCDRLDNLRSMRFQDNKTRIRRYTRETEKKYLPLAEELHPYLHRELRMEITHAKARLRR